MEYLEGKTLKELLVARGATPIRVAVDYARQILAALEFAHRNGIVHRDIKPHNIIVAPDGRVKVMDFGIARSGSSQVTEAGSIIGTAQYLSPEQARGAPAAPPADIYSAGVVLYEMLTGSVPFAGDTPLEVAMKHLSAIPEPPSGEAARRSRTSSTRSSCGRWRRIPSERYGSAEEMDADLARVAAGLSVSPATEEAATSVLWPAPERPHAATRRHRAAPRPRRRTGRRPTATTSTSAPSGAGPIWPWLLAGLLLRRGRRVRVAITSTTGSPTRSPAQSPSRCRSSRASSQTAGGAGDLASGARCRRSASDRTRMSRSAASSTRIPAAGTRVDKDTTVVIFVSSG